MIELRAEAALLDVEGTTSSVAYVYDVMFPFARRELERFVSERWADESMRSVRDQFARDAGAADFAAWSEAHADPRRLVIDEAVRLMDGDVKATGLKQLQGLIWEAGFRSGELRSHLFAEVADALGRWRTAGVDLRIYSSGSVHAQRLFFGHTEAGDLLPLLSGHYDTTIGPKREAASYQAIVADWIAANGGVSADRIAFFSDVTEELNAARDAGLRTVLVERPGNAPPTAAEPPHAAITSFDEIRWLI